MGRRRSLRVVSLALICWSAEMTLLFIDMVLTHNVPVLNDTVVVFVVD